MFRFIVTVPRTPATRSARARADRRVDPGGMWYRRRRPAAVTPQAGTDGQSASATLDNTTEESESNRQSPAVDDEELASAERVSGEEALLTNARLYADAVGISLEDALAQFQCKRNWAGWSWNQRCGRRPGTTSPGSGSSVTLQALAIVGLEAAEGAKEG